jgi:hypothetical protein
MTEDLIREYLTKNLSIGVFMKTEKEDTGTVLWVGVELCLGKYVICCDSSCVVLPCEED